MLRWAFLSLLIFPAIAHCETIRLANNPALSPDGKWLAFDWNGDIWLAPSTGGEAKQRSANPARDAFPRFSPDGKELAFVSDREGSLQIFTIPIDGGVPKQLTYHTAGSLLQEYTPDGTGLLIKGTRDHFWRHGDRFFTIQRDQRSAERLLFDDYGTDGTLSPDGKKLLFTREGEGWWRKGYKGSRVTQVWLHNLDAKTFTKVLHEDFGCRWPMWKPDASGFYFVGEHAQGSNLLSYDFASKSKTQLTRFKEDGIVFPAIARNGSKIVFRHLFDLYAFDPASKQTTKLNLYHTADRVGRKSELRTLTTATSAAFSRDGLEIAMIAGGDLWIMDTELREPRQVTATATDEANPLFMPDGGSLLYVANLGNRFAIAQATRKDAKKYWWQNREFVITHLLEMDEQPTRLKLSPDAKTLAYVRGRGDLWTLDLADKKPKQILAGWNTPDFDWSPDGKWFVYGQLDEEFNRDIWLRPSDGTGKPFNLSRHHFSEHDPVWSPDGKMIAYAGRRASGEAGAHVCVVSLNPEDDDTTARDRKLEKALDKMKSRATPVKAGKDEPKELKKPTGVNIDFDRLHERVKRFNLGEGAANTLFWSPDSKKLAFTGTFEGKAGTYAIDVAISMAPKSLTSTAGANPVWLKSGNQIVWLVNGIPTSTPGVASAGGDPAPTPAPVTIPKKGGFVPKSPIAAPATGGGFTFSARQQVDLSARNAAIFDTCWRIMRDHWYDAKLGNADWTKVREKYRPLAESAPDRETVVTSVQMMLGELNGSHLGFTMNPTDAVTKAAETRDVTPHLGVRFDHAFAGPGLKVRDVLLGGPADKKRSRLAAGDIITKIDGIAVGPNVDLTTILNGPLDREITLTVNGNDITLRPIAYAAAQAMLYDHWLQHNRRLVENASKGSLGYLHISAMAMPNFRKFEDELVSQGAGKDGLIIDVRENPGGSITDHLLTALTQPVHAITVPRGGGPGYPLDRKVYVSWHKPIVVLCNQNSGSNAEIFSHAIKTLKRGQVVGVTTAGAVVSTGAAPVMDAGLLRLPTRGWFTLNDGEDMEKNGAAPHHVIWPDPTTLPSGRDAQLTKAIEVLARDVTAWKARPQPKLKLSTERP